MSKIKIPEELKKFLHIKNIRYSNTSLELMAEVFNLGVYYGNPDNVDTVATIIPGGVNYVDVDRLLS